MIEIRASVPLPDEEEDKRYIDIFKKIERGLRTNYIDPYTNNVWLVEDYVNGKTRGVEVETKYGRFLGTAYPATIISRDISGESEDMVFYHANVINKDTVKGTSLPELKKRLAVCIKETICGNNKYAKEKEAIISYLYSDEFKSLHQMTTLDVDKIVMGIWDSLQRRDIVVSFDNLTDGIVEQTVKDFKKYSDEFVSLYNKSRTVRTFVSIQTKMFEEKESLKDLEKRLEAVGRNGAESKFLKYAIDKCESRINKLKSDFRAIKLQKPLIINRFIKTQSNLRVVYSFFLGGRATELVGGEQSAITEMFERLQNETGFTRFCKDNKIPKKGWFV